MLKRGILGRIHINLEFDFHGLIFCCGSRKLFICEKQEQMLFRVAFYKCRPDVAVLCLILLRNLYMQSEGPDLFFKHREILR